MFSNRLRLGYWSKIDRYAQQTSSARTRRWSTRMWMAWRAEWTIQEGVRFQKGGTLLPPGGTRCGWVLSARRKTRFALTLRKLTRHDGFFTTGSCYMSMVVVSREKFSASRTLRPSTYRTVALAKGWLWPSPRLLCARLPAPKNELWSFCCYYDNNKLSIQRNSVIILHFVLQIASRRFIWSIRPFYDAELFSNVQLIAQLLFDDVLRDSLFVT